MDVGTTGLMFVDDMHSPLLGHAFMNRKVGDGVYVKESGVLCVCVCDHHGLYVTPCRSAYGPGSKRERPTLIPHLVSPDHRPPPPPLPHLQAQAADHVRPCAL